MKLGCTLQTTNQFNHCWLGKFSFKYSMGDFSLTETFAHYPKKKKNVLSVEKRGQFQLIPLLPKKKNSTNSSVLFSTHMII